MPFVMFLMAILALLFGVGLLRFIFAAIFGLARWFWIAIPYAVVGYVFYVCYCKISGKENVLESFTKKIGEKKS